MPDWNGSTWEYVTAYTIPTSETLLSNAGDLYRLVVATTAANLSNPSCSITDVANIITLNIIDCGVPLAAQLLSFNWQKNNGLAEADLIDASGKIVRHKTTDLLAGITRIIFENTSDLVPGMYYLRIRSQDGYIGKQC